MKGHIRIVTISTLLLLSACGGSDSDSEQPSESQRPDAATLLNDAGTAIDAVQTLRFTLDIEGRTNVDAAGSIRLLEARGTLARPDMVDVQFQVRLLGTQTASIRMITVGDQSWTTDLITGNWGPAPDEFGYDPGVLFDTDDGLAPVMRAIQDPTVTGEESIDGRSAWKIEGTIDEETIGPVTGETMHGTIDLGLWIDKETNRPLRFHLAEGDESGNDEPATWTMELGTFDEPATIEPPL